MDTNRHEFYKAILSHSTSLLLAFIRVDSWLKRKPQHFDGGGDFDVLVADNEI
jgi:hypothetical protein